MLFNSVEFIFLFLPVTLAGVYALTATGKRRVALGWLVLCSLFFYGYFKPEYLLLIGVSILVNFACGQRIVAARALGRIRPATMWLAAGLVFNLGLLGYYKYFGFFVDTAARLTGAGWSAPEILLPIGISFFTFQQIAYLMDCHVGAAHQTRLLEYSLFVSYFPQLIAGPIVHPNTVLPQFERSDVLRLRAYRLCEGLTLFFLGLGKKVVLADAFGIWASDGFEAIAAGHTLTMIEAWAAVLSYHLQIYFDFSGYSDMAVGLGWMVGVRLPVNFRSPYKATSITEFWRRWHITLSTFLRDYLYIPLGGSRRGKARRWTNLFLTMLLGGLWHGAGATFVFWGGLHGLYLACNHFWRDVRTRVPGLGRDFGPAGTALAWMLTTLAVIVAWVFFRAPDFQTATRMLACMADIRNLALPSEFAGALGFLSPVVEWVPKLPHLGGGLPSGYAEVTGFMVLGTAIVLLGKPLEFLGERTRYLLLVPTLALTLQKVLVSTKASEFLYFQF